MIRTETVAVEAYDTDLASFASRLDAAIAEACGRLEAEGAEILGPVQTVPLRTARDDGTAADAAHDVWSVENGVLATISYRVAD